MTADATPAHHVPRPQGGNARLAAADVADSVGHAGQVRVAARPLEDGQRPVAEQGREGADPVQREEPYIDRDESGSGLDA